MILADTNVLSEIISRRPSEAVLRWIDDQPRQYLFTTTISMAEMMHGLAALPEGRRQAYLSRSIERIFTEDFQGRVLPFDEPAARLFGVIVAARKKIGRPIGQFDAQIAAIAQSRGAAIATRDIGGFEHCGVKLINPWNYSN